MLGLLHFMQFPSPDQIKIYVCFVSYYMVFIYNVHIGLRGPKYSIFFDFSAHTLSTASFEASGQRRIIPRYCVSWYADVCSAFVDCENVKTEYQFQNILQKFIAFVHIVRFMFYLPHSVAKYIFKKFQ